MRTTERLRRAIRLQEADEAQGHAFGLEDTEMRIVQRVLRTGSAWFNGSLDPHPRIVALGLALAIVESEQSPKFSSEPKP